MASTDERFTTVRSEGALLPPDLLQRIAEGDGDLKGLRPDDYHLVGEKLNEAINRAWSRVQGAWAVYSTATRKIADDEPTTSLTREKWLLPLFAALDYGRLTPTPAIEIDSKRYAISHRWQRTPIHLVGRGVDLDRRSPGVAGAARSSPHSQVQELLNRSDEHLWALVSNGRRLRLLRDNLSLTRQAYVEFDLEALMEGQVYPDFALLWLLCHQSRVEGETPEECWLERWARAAQEQGTRALDRLRDGVAEAISALGRGFLLHPANAELRDKLHAGTLDKQDYYRQLLRQVFRLIFLFVAEDRTDSVGRALLFDPQGAEEAMERYRRYYSTARLRQLAERRRGSTHPDLWRVLALVMGKLDRDGSPELALPALGSFLWSPQATPDLEGCDIANRDLLDAVRALAFTEHDRVLRAVDYRNLGPEELGSVYESLLELHPVLDSEGNRFELASAAGHERKTTGSYYTPSSLIACLLDSALDPVLDEASAADDPEAAILALRVCDPACGSGHFLIAAAHRIAKRLAAVRTGDDEPSPEATRTALRDVIGHSIYGVDLNPMAVELCKVNLWLDALEPGKPLSFLDHHIRCGNSLLGVTPALLEQGIPDEAFKPIEGDDKAFCTHWRKKNKEYRKSRQLTIPVSADAPWERLGDIAASMIRLDSITDGTVAGVRRKEKLYAELVASSGYEHGRLWADAWCAAFVWNKRESPERPYPITEEVFRKIERNPYSVAGWLKEEVKRLADEYQFFHWHLAFPEVFRVAVSGEAAENEQTGWVGGFDVVLGNPPWEKPQAEEVPFFASRDADIAALKGAARKKAIGRLKESDPILAEEWSSYRRSVASQDAIVRRGGTFPYTARGKFNSFALFSELASELHAGMASLLVPTGIATEKTSAEFFWHCVSTGRLRAVYDFENRDRLFPAVHSSYRFCVFTLGGAAEETDPAFKVAYYLSQASHLRDPSEIFELHASDIAAINPCTKTLPIFRDRRETAIALKVHRRVPVLRDQSRKRGIGWEIALHRMINMSDDSAEFRIVSGADVLAADRVRLYEAKMFHHFDHRWASLAKEAEPLSKKKPDSLATPRYDVPVQLVRNKLPDSWSRPWLLAWRDITRSTDERTVISTVLPLCGVGNTAFLLYPQASPKLAAALIANLSSFSLDFIARLKTTGTHLPISAMSELPCIPPGRLTALESWCSAESVVSNWILTRALELSYTAWDLQPFAQDCGYDGPPFRWDEDRRFLLRCELDAAFFHLYGIERDDVDYIMETFPIVRKRDLKKHGSFRTKHQILDIYDTMQRAADSGEPYQTLLDPPPADSRVTHPSRAISEMASLPDGAWERPMADPEAEQTSVLAAVLRSSLGPIPIRQVRLAALLATSPGLLSHSLPADEVAHWRRLVGPEAESSGAGDSPVPLPEDAAWGGAVRQLRGVDALIEDLVAQTWAPGEKVSEIGTTGWPAGRVGVVLEVLRHREAEELIQTLPRPMRAWIDAKAA